MMAGLILGVGSIGVENGCITSVWFGLGSGAKFKPRPDTDMQPGPLIHGSGLWLCYYGVGNGCRVVNRVLHKI
jgi:hypothetical protein